MPHNDRDEFREFRERNTSFQQKLVGAVGCL